MHSIPAGSYSGDGVYKSTDGGKARTNMGLKDSRQAPGCRSGNINVQV